VLGIARDVDQKAIKDAFRTLALKYHPDRNKEPGAEERFKEIAEAYAILSDPAKRAEYDARGFAGVAGTSREDLCSGINFEDIFGGLNFDFDLWHTVTLPLSDAVLGATLKVHALDGAIEVTVPAGTQSDAILRLKGKGLPVFKSDRLGDLYLRIRLKVPEHLSHEERELYEQVRAISHKPHPGMSE
jgi:DnaJ-class molecular chaperone